MRYSMVLWLVALIACAVLGVVVGTDGRQSDLWPHHFGFYIAAASVLAGLAFGWRAAALPVVGIVTFGIVRLVTLSTTSGDDDQRVLFVLYFTYYPVLFMIPALVGASIRAAVCRLVDRPASASR